MNYCTTIDSPIDPLLLTSDGKHLTGVHMDAERARRDLTGEWRDDPAPFSAVIAQLQAYFAGKRQAFDLPIKPRGTSFQQAVWAALQGIPHGVTVSYKAIAEQIGSPKAVRAVGLANSKNPVAIIVPCHRVIGSSGKLTGYAGGLTRKQWLLAHEAGQSAESINLSLAL